MLYVVAHAGVGGAREALALQPGHMCGCAGSGCGGAVCRAAMRLPRCDLARSPNIGGRRILFGSELCACYQSLIPAISGGARAIGGGGVRVLVYACSRGPEWYSGVGGDGRRTTTSRRLSLVASGDLAARLSGDGHRGTQDCLDVVRLPCYWLGPGAHILVVLAVNSPGLSRVKSLRVQLSEPGRETQQ